MKNFSVITSVSIALLKNCQIPDKKITGLKLSDILHPGSTFQPISDIKPLSCSFEENEKKSEAGTYFEKKLKFDISKLRPEITMQLNQYSNKQLIALITDGNGYSLIIFPLIMTIKRNLPGTVKGANVTEITLSGNGVSESPFVNIDL